MTGEQVTSKGGPTLVSLTQYAAHRGVAKSMVTKWKGLGRLVLVGKLVDRDASDKLLGAVQDRTRGGKRQAVGRKDAPPQGEAASGGGSGQAPESPPAPSAPEPAIVSATVEDKRASAEWKRARTDRELGKLVDRSEAEDAAEGCAAITRKSFATLSARLGGAVAEALGVDARKIFPILDDEARRMSNELADAIEQFVGSL